MASQTSTTAEQAKRKRSSATGHRDRLEARLSPEVKDLLQRAAAIRGSSLTDFVLSSAQEAAQRAIREHDVITLSVRDSEHFARLLLHPPEPSERLRAAARRYADAVEQ